MSTVESSPMTVVESVRVDSTSIRLSPRFVESFERGSDRILHVMYDEVAPVLSESFQDLLEGGSGQLDVLSRVAELVGLSGFAVDGPLDNADDEAFAQRVAWRSTARWAVLGLLWTLAERCPAESWSPNDWAEAVLDEGGVKPRSKSGLPGEDEHMALRIVAEQLLGSSIGQRGRALWLRNLPVVVEVRDEAEVAVSGVRPLALVEAAGAPSAPEIALKKGNRILLASEDVEERFDLTGERERIDDIFTMLDDGEIRLGDSSAPVVSGLLLLYER